MATTKTQMWSLIQLGPHSFEVVTGPDLGYGTEIEVVPRSELDELRAERDDMEKRINNDFGLLGERHDEIERLRKVEEAAHEMFQVIEDEFPSIHVMRWRAALRPSGLREPTDGPPED